MSCCRTPNTSTPNPSDDDLSRVTLPDHLPDLSHSDNGDEFVTLAKYNELKAEMTQLKAQFTQQQAEITQQRAETAAIKNQFSAMTQENTCINRLLGQLLEQRTRHLDNLVPQQQEATIPSTDINRHNMRDLYNMLSNSAPKFLMPLMQLALGPNKMAVGNCSGGSQHQAHDNEVFQHGWKVT